MTAESLTQSESARFSTAAEARFRIDAPNSRPRFIPVFALGRRSEELLKTLQEEGAAATAFGVSASHQSKSGEKSAKVLIRDLVSGAVTDLGESVMAADHVVIVASAGDDIEFASIIGEACSAFGIPATALVFGDGCVADEAMSKTASRFRNWVAMLVLANSDDYVVSMLHALRAGKKKST